MSETHQRSQVAIIFTTVFVYLLGFGIVIPILPLISRDFGADALQTGLLLSSFSLMQFLFAPFWGRLSDRFGRRPVLLGCLLGEGLTYLLFAVARDLPTVFAARLLAGFFGASISTASAAISDVTPPHQRSRGMAVIGVAFGLGFVFGPAIGGGLALWARSISSAPPFGVSFVMCWVAAICLVNAAVGWKIYRETLKPENRRQSHGGRWRRLVQQVRKPVVGPLMAVFFLAAFAMSSMEANLVLFMQDRFGWGVKEVSFGFAYVGVMLVLTQGLIVRRLLPRIGERRTMALGLLLFAAGLAGIAVAPSVAAMGVTMTLLALGNGLINPSILGSISLLSGANEQGEVMGTTQSLSSLGRIVGPAFGGWLFQAVHFTAPFWISGFLAASGFLIVLVISSRLPNAAQRGNT